MAIFDKHRVHLGLPIQQDAPLLKLVAYSNRLNDIKSARDGTEDGLSSHLNNTLLLLATRTITYNVQVQPSELIARKSGRLVAARLALAHTDLP